ncbi:hypothetical protein BDY19DRAFT_458031 [Irpex rosettiformis]|uniref:Uncharacterized protein n=1 Tax=Irpex rosettiformis TaxID=378272 RepID=A0ACB8TT42_9APHY|nr:hypothetical protein BDY19DRAFT_458031 [Irpex rosettiformis]
MFFSVARSRLFIASLLAFTHVANAHVNTLFTSSVSYCSPPESILIQQFDIAYYPQNRSIAYNVSLASVRPHLNVSANLFVNVYGMRPFNISLDLCTLLHGAFCPLPTYNFTGFDQIILPDSIDIASSLPGVAYKIPDLEAFVQLTFTESSTSKTVACIQATVSNGWSTRQKAVEWSTGAIALLALVSAIWWSYVRPDALAPVRLMDLMYLFQTIASSGLLALNYPSVYRAYTLNFAWSLGLFAQSPSSSIQNTINNMRSHTGVAVTGDGSSAVSLVNRKLSPYNNIAQVNQLMSPILFGTNSTGHTVSPQSNIFVGGNVATVTKESDNVLEAGIAIYTNYIGIATANAFMTIFFTSLILFAIALAILGLGYIFILAIGRTPWGQQRQATLGRARAGYPAFARAWGLRVALVCVIPVFIFTFFQWTLNDSWASVLLSVILWLIILVSIIAPIIFLLRPTLFTRWTGDLDPAASTTLLPLVAALRPQRFYYVLATFIAILVKTLVAGFGQAHGMVQTIILLITEIVLFATLLVFRPFCTRGADILAVILSIFRVVCTGLMIAFSESLHLDAIPRVVVGIVIAVIYSVAVVLMFFNVLVNLGLLQLVPTPWRRRKELSVSTDATVLSSGRSLDDEEKKIAGSGKRSGSDLSEKSSHVSQKITPVPSSIFRERPGNPEPSHTPDTPSPISPATTATRLSQFSDPPDLTPTTATMSTLGEQLPRRWSFQHSRPPSASAASHYSGGLSPRWPVTPGTTESEYVTPRESWRRSSSAFEHQTIPEHAAS